MRHGIWDVRCCRFSSLERRFEKREGGAAEASGDDDFLPVRLVACRGDGAMDIAAVEALGRRVSIATGEAVDTCTVPRSGWTGLLRNVPPPSGGGASRNVDDDDYGDPASHVVAVARRGSRRSGGKLSSSSSSSSSPPPLPPPPPAPPILVLVGLKYRGNVGSIVRAAVQADCFGEIHIVEERQPPTGEVHGDGRRGGGTGNNGDGNGDGGSGSVTAGKAKNSRRARKKKQQQQQQQQQLQLQQHQPHSLPEVLPVDSNGAAGDGDDRSPPAAAAPPLPPPKVVSPAAVGGSAEGGVLELELEQHAKLERHAAWTDADVAYYSLWNAPLLPTRRFASVDDFFAHANNANNASTNAASSDAFPETCDASTSSEAPVSNSSAAGTTSSENRLLSQCGGGCCHRRRPRIVGVDGGTHVEGRPLSLYSAEAMRALRWRRRQKQGQEEEEAQNRRGVEKEEPDGGGGGGDDDDHPAEQLYIAMGAEDQGLPIAFLEKCEQLVMIPCLSASVNVASAFSSVLAVMQLADAMT
jgi:hypothetical protein